jgi:Sec-independent protein translocase protein TatA
MFDFLHNIGPTELILLALILVFFFGAKVVVNLARTSGESVREIKKMKKEFVRVIKDDEDSKD